MKALKHFIIIILTAGFIFSANAQNYYGIQGGMGITDLNIASASGMDQLTTSSTGFTFGGIFGYNFNENLSLEFALMYTQKGGTQMANSGNPNIDINMSVLEIPLLAKVSFGSSVSPYLKAGVSVGYILDSEAQAEYGGVVTGEVLKAYSADLNDVLQDVDVGVILGAGVSFSLGKSQLFIEGRYNLSLFDLYKGGQITWQSADETFVVEGNEAAELYNKGIQLMIGITFPNY
jgi:hypothetical protein